jgi:hypothetical protein
VRGDVSSQLFPRSQKRDASHFRGLIGLLKVFLLTGLQSPGNFDINSHIGPKTTVKKQMLLTPRSRLRHLRNIVAHNSPSSYSTAYNAAVLLVERCCGCAGDTTKRKFSAVRAFIAF